MAQETTGQASGPTLAELVEHLMQFEGPPEQFLLHLLAVQCQVGQAESGAILRVSENEQAEALAVFPPLEKGQTTPVWLAQSAEIIPRIAKAGQVVVRPVQTGEEFYAEQAGNHLILMPIRGGAGVRGVAAFLIQTDNPTVLDQCRERLQLTISLLGLYEMRLTLQMRRGDMQRMREACEVLAAVNEQTRLTAAGMAFCNDIAARWNANRVSLGFLRGRYVKMVTMSHTEKITRKTNLVQDIESAMEESLDQDQEVLAPAGPEVVFVNRAARELASRHGPSNVISLPMRHRGEVVAVTTLERAPDQSLSLDEVETLRLTCDLSTARLVDLHEHDKWIGAKAAGAMRKGLATLLGPSHTWVKAVALAIVAILLFLCLAKGPFRAEATFVIEATELRVVPAPFNGFLFDVYVDPGDAVTVNQTLAKLDTSELIWRLKQAQADATAYRKQATLAQTEGTTVEVQIAEALAEKADAEIGLLQYRLEHAEIKSPYNGIVLTGDLRRQKGAPLDVGAILFEIAPLESLRAKLHVPEKRIADVFAAQKDDQPLSGKLAAASDPSQYIGFEVERINQVAEVVNQTNAFQVRARLLLEETDQAKKWLRPGMEGMAKIDLGRRSYAWIWTRDPVNWIRMKLWVLGLWG